MRIIGIAGWSGTGKTTLLTKVIPLLVGRGLKVSTLKHAHHGFDVDQPGKDSHAHRLAGATEVLISSARRWALMHEVREGREASLYELLQKMSPVDLVVVEGFKAALHPKIEVYRREVGKPPFHPDNPNVVGIASDTPFPQANRPVVPIDDIARVADLMVDKAEPVATVLSRAGINPSPAGVAIAAPVVPLV